MIEDRDPVLVMTLEDAKTILWADGISNEEEPSILGVVEWSALVEKARKVVALQDLLER